MRDGLDANSSDTVNGAFTKEENIENEENAENDCTHAHKAENWQIRQKMSLNYSIDATKRQKNEIESYELSFSVTAAE